MEGVHYHAVWCSYLNQQFEANQPLGIENLVNGIDFIVSIFPVNTIRPPIAGSILGQCCRQWVNIESAHCECVMFSGILFSFWNPINVDYYR